MSNLIAGETLRVLLVSAREEMRDTVGEALAARAGDHRLYWVAQAELAAGRAADLAPHAVLVDDELDGANAVSLIGQLAGRAPGAAILALVAGDGLDRARQAVLAGARAFIPKPVEAEELLAALRQVLAGRSPAGTAATAEAEGANGRTVAFCAPKGGTGRTTLAINTAISLHKMTGEATCLVDADYAAPAVDVALNLRHERTIADLLPRLARLDRELVAGILAGHASGVRVLTAPPPADLGSPISLPQVQQVLVWLRRIFPWVVVDLGLPMDETAFAFLDGADRIVMSVLPEMVGLRNTRLMLDQLQGRGYPDEKVWLVLNRATMRGGVSVGDIEERLRVKVRYRIPDDQPLATYSVNRGVPLVMSHPQSAVARAVNGLARELARETRAAEEAAPATKARAPGLMGRWLGRTRAAGA